MKLVPVSVQRPFTDRTSEAAASAKSESAKPDSPGGFTASIADVANADEQLKTLKNSYNVTANMRVAFREWLASNT